MSAASLHARRNLHAPVAAPEARISCALHEIHPLGVSIAKPGTPDARLATDSHKSDKPPSSDGLSKPFPKSLRPPGQRPSGGQPGHPGHTLRMVEKTDRIVTHRVERCTACGQSLDTFPPDILDRFRDHSPSILTLLDDFAVPFDNNQAERDLRIMKVRQKSQAPSAGLLKKLLTPARAYLNCYHAICVAQAPPEIASRPIPKHLSCMIACESPQSWRCCDQALSSRDRALSRRRARIA